MKVFKKSFLFLILGVAVGSLGGCKNKKETVKDPLVIPTVDVASLQVNLPTRPARFSGELRSDDNYEYIDLYEFSDFHGAVNYEEHDSGSTVYAGLPKLATYFNEKREQNSGGTVILSSGDMFQGSADSNLTRGYLVNYCMQYIGLDAMAIGNHEFDWSTEWIKKNAELRYGTDAPVPYLGANIMKNGHMLDFLSESTIVERGGHKIGVIGVIGSTLEYSVLKTALDGCEFVPYADIVKTASDGLRAQGCDVVVLLAHQGADDIESVNGVDIVFGGHAHDDVKHIYGSVPALATENYGQSVAHASLKYDKNTKEFLGVENNYDIEKMANVASSLSEDSNIKNIMNQYAPAINEIKNIRLAKTDKKLSLQTALKNICTKSLHEAAVSSVSNVPEIDGNKIVAALHNVRGGIRTDIKAGEITYNDVYKSFPFDNEIVLIKVKGSEVYDLLKTTKINGLGIYRIFEDRSYFNANEDYYLATTDYLALSSSAFNLHDEDFVRTGRVVRDVVANKIYQLDDIKEATWSATQTCYLSVN